MNNWEQDKGEEFYTYKRSNRKEYSLDDIIVRTLHNHRPMRYEKGWYCALRHRDSKWLGPYKTKEEAMAIGLLLTID